MAADLPPPSRKIYSMTYQKVTLASPQPTRCQTSAHSPSRYPTQTRAPRNVAWAWRELRYLAFLLRSHLLGTMRRGKACFDSFRGHMAIQFATEPPSVDFGQAFERAPDGTYREDTRTLARSEYTRGLLAIRDWADSGDLQMFLMGFDAGEQWALRSEDSSTYNAPQIPAWLLLANQKVDQAIKASSRHTSDAIPAAIAEITRGDD
jgi:hypothetical protein